MDVKRAVFVSLLLLLAGVGVYATTGLYPTTGVGSTTGLGATTGSDAATGVDATTGRDPTAAETTGPDRGSGGVAVALSERGCPDDTARDPGSLTVVPDTAETGGAKMREAEEAEIQEIEEAEMQEAEASGVRRRGFVLHTTVVYGSGERPAFSLSRSQPDVYTLAITADPADERSRATPLYTPACSAEAAVTVWGRTPTPPDRLRITVDGTVLVDRLVPDHRVVWSFPRVVGADTTATADDRASKRPAPDTDG